MPLLIRRARGALLRLVRRRWLAMLIGAALVAPAAWVQFGAAGGPWWVDGVGLILGATGAALFYAGLTGPGPDWVDDADATARRPRRG